MMEEKTLTRNESADLVRKIWSMMVELAPTATNVVRDVGADIYIEDACIADGMHVNSMHVDHYNWLYKALSDSTVLAMAESLAARARYIADGMISVPWRD